MQKIELSSEEEFYKIINSKNNIIVKFYTKTCSGCKILDKTLEDLEKTELLPCLVINTDAELFPKLATQYHVRSVPSLLRFSTDGVTQIEKKYSGSIADKEELLKFIGESDHNK